MAANPDKMSPAGKPPVPRQPAPDRPLELRQVLEGLLADGMLTAEQAGPFLQNPLLHQKSKEHPLEVVARQKWVNAKDPNMVLDLERLTRWLASKTGLTYMRIDPLKMNVGAVADLVSVPYAERFQILPITSDGTTLVVATAQPYMREWEHELARLHRLRIERVLANPEDIRKFLKEFYDVGRAIRKASNAAELQVTSGVLNLEQMVELGRADKLDANDRHVVNIVDWLLQYAFSQRASDIHLEPRRDVGRIRLRIDGVLHQVQEIPAVVMSAMTSRIKALGRMDLVEKRRPQDGRLKTKTPMGQEVELRLSTMPTAFGEKLVMRIFDPSVLQQNFSELGLLAEDTERWQKMLDKPHGLVLVTGPTGSGKTTTLYSALRKLARPEVNVCTIEDPIELVEPSFNQMQVQSNIGVDFAVGVRNLLRQDPDIIMVGEIRDLPTAEMAVQAALTGHLVLSTLHTNDSVSAVTRLLEIGLPAYLIRDTLLGVVAQRLVRTLCPHCKKPLPEAEMDWDDLEPPKVPDHAPTFFQAAGCDDCRNTGYKGRTGIFEVLTVTEDLGTRITPQAELVALRDHALKEGMHTLRASGARKVYDGLTTVKEVKRVAPSARGNG
jgi:general secretion pathway protein E